VRDYQIYGLLKCDAESFREQIPTFRIFHLRSFPMQLLTILLQVVLLHALEYLLSEHQIIFNAH
jgi:hypothetical protein